MVRNMSNIVGLCLAFKGTNYGALLQSYATQYIIDRYGLETEILDYYPGKDRGLIISPEGLVYVLIGKVRKVFSKDVPERLDQIHIVNKEHRIQAANYFRESRLHSIVEIHGYEQLHDYSKKYRVVIVGSDQQWNYNVCYTYFRTLRFVPKGVKRASYATSMGVSSYPWYVRRLAADFLKKIDNLSVREEQGKQIVHRMCGRTAEVVLDPTFLLTKTEWEELIPHKTIREPGYLFCFILGDNPAMKRKAREYADRNNLIIVSILSNEVNVNDSEYSDDILIGQSPEEFVNLIRGADVIFTDSFHGLAFSLINEKQVYVTYRIRKNTGSRNSRIDNVLEKIGLLKQLIKDPAKDKFVESKIDYSEVNKTIEQLRRESLAFLEKAIGIK